MIAKIKGEKIKEGSISLSALATEVKDKIENAVSAASGADWNAREEEAGYIKNKPFYTFIVEDSIVNSSTDTLIEFNNPFDIPTELSIDYDYYEETDHIVGNKTINNIITGTTYLKDSLGIGGVGLYMDVYEGKLYMQIEASLPISNGNFIVHLKYIKTIDEKYLPDSILKTTPQILSEAEKTQVKINLGLIVDEYDEYDIVDNLDLPFISGQGENSAVLKDANNTTGGTPITDGDYERPNPNTYSSAEMQADLDNGLFGKNATAEGQYTMAVGPYSHTEGTLTYAEGLATHAEGHRSAAIGNFSHAEGNKSRAIGKYSHAEGNDNWAEGWWSHVEGSDTKTTPTSRATHAEGYRTIAGAIDIDGTAETKEAAYQRFFDKFHPDSTEDNLSTSSTGAPEDGIKDNTNTGSCSHAEGHTTHAHGRYSHTEGSSTAALGDRAHAEGWETIAYGTYSHAEGLKTIAKGDGAHAEGGSTQAKGARSHTEGFYGIASGYAAHAEGIRTVAEGQSSHAEGNRAKAIGNQSHAEGLGTIANNAAEHASGQYNVSTKSSSKSQATQFSIGIGTSDTDRKNAFEVKQNGDIYITGVDGTLQNALNNSGSNAAEQSDWNAKEGEAGYIANRTHYLTSNFVQSDVESLIDDSEYGAIYYLSIDLQGNYTNIFLFKIIHNNEVKIVSCNYGESTTFNIGGESYEITIIDSTLAHIYHSDRYSVIPVPEFEVYECSNTLINQDDVNAVYKQLDEIYLPDTILKTTSQTLSENEKTQVKINLDINQFYQLSNIESNNAFNIEEFISKFGTLCNIESNDDTYEYTAKLSIREKMDFMNSVLILDEENNFYKCLAINNANDYSNIAIFNNNNYNPFTSINIVVSGTFTYDEWDIFNINSYNNIKWEYVINNDEYYI